MQTALQTPAYDEQLANYLDHASLVYEGKKTTVELYKADTFTFVFNRREGPFVRLSTSFTYTDEIDYRELLNTMRDIAPLRCWRLSA